MAENSRRAKTSTPRYTNVAIGLHWIIAMLILGQIFGGLYMVRALPDGPDKFELYQLHKSFGITILLLSLLRLGWRIAHRPPALPSGMANWERIGARASHAAFYGLMIGVPLGGWALVSASPFASSAPTFLFGVIPWPHLPFFEGVADRDALAERISGLHEFFALSTLGLLGLHIAAALKHHIVNRDHVLSAMLPIIRPRNSQ
ncbi:MAG: cytochrome b [Pseudomonadota bacterium]